MCVAIPARILSLDDEKNIARAELSGNIIEINTRLVTAEIGDYVLVHAGCAVEVLRQESALEILSLFEELKAASEL